MKSIKTILPFFLLLIIFTSCLQDSCVRDETYIRYDPVYLTKEEIQTDMVIESPQALKNPGKMYYYQQYLMINEPREGIHIIDNHDPANPVQVAFWRLKGNVDIAIKEGRLYLDQYTDLLTFDITNFLTPTFICRRSNVFETQWIDPVKGYLMEYTQTPVRQKVNCVYDRGIYYLEGDVLWVNANDVTSMGNGEGVNPAVVNGNSGIAGSYTRFCFNAQYLYTIDQFNLVPFDLNGGGCPLPQTQVNVGRSIETIFPYKDHLFIGSPTGVFIYDASQPLSPEFKSQFNHATGCDPVICRNDIAYVTIHNGTTCGGSVNQLDILDIKDLSNPKLIQSYNLKKPQGLAIAGNYLYICDEGLKVYDNTDPMELVLKAYLEEIKVTDAIILSDSLLLLVGEGGFYQYDITNPVKPNLISKLEL